MQTPVPLCIKPKTSLQRRSCRTQWVQILGAAAILLALILTRPGSARIGGNAPEVFRPPAVQWTLLGRQWSPGG